MNVGNPPPLPTQPPGSGGQPSSPAPTGSGPRRRTVWKPALLGGLGGLVIVALIIGGVSVIRAKQTAGFDRPPEAAGGVDTSAISGYELGRMPSGIVEPDDGGYLYMSGKDADAIVMTRHGASTPKWIAPIPHSTGKSAAGAKDGADSGDSGDASATTGCTGSGSAVRCGDTRVDLSTGDTAAADGGSGSESSPGGGGTKANGSDTEGAAPSVHDDGSVTVDGITISRDKDVIVGKDADGSEVWRITVKGASGFTVHGQQLYVQSGDTVYTFDFSHRGRDANVVPSTTPSAAKKLTKADFASGTLPMPAWCHEYVTAPGASKAGRGKGDFVKVPFSGGKFHPKSATASYQGAEITDVAPMTVAGKPAAAVQFTCNGGGSYSYDSVAVYDADRKPLGSVEYAGADAKALMGSAPKLYVKMHATGDYLRLEVPVGVYGDDDCSGCDRSGSGTYTYRVSDGKLHAKDAVLRADGKNVRMPSEKSVQKFLDAVRTGNDDYAAQHATSDQMKTLDDVLGDGMESQSPTVRSVQFGKGVRADTCEVIRPTSADEYSDSSTYYFGNGNSIFTIGDDKNKARPGDIICGIVTDEVGMMQGDSDSKSYAISILLRGNATGDVQAFNFGRQFS